MTLRERIGAASPLPDDVQTPRNRSTGVGSQAFQKLKVELHHGLLDRVDLAGMQRLSPSELREELRILVEKMLAEEGVALNEFERTTIVQEIQNEMLGLGPLEPLLADPTISDILVNTYSSVYVERRGKLEPTAVRFNDDGHLRKIIDKIVSRVGRRVDESSPMVDARLPDGSRVNAIIPPLAIDGPILSIRRFAVNPYTMRDFLAFKSLTAEMAEVLEGLAKAKINLLISGGTGSGKTTLLNILSGYIPADERVITIEDAAELQLQQPHVVRLETRPPNIEGKGEVTQRALVRNALRMRPDRIIVGEVRGAEAVDMLQAMNTGHEGSMTTIHANTPRDALTRLENMIGMAGMNLPPKASRQQISAALSVVLQIARLTDGRRKVVSFQEITGMEGEMITMQEIFTFRQTGLGDDGTVLGHFCATGVRPRLIERLNAFGIEVPERLFDPTRHYE
ncbi:MAG: CpaF family protein [Burkholderiaceae bacterium]